MRVVIDEKKCMGYASCVNSAPEIFDVDEDRNIAKIIAPSITPEMRNELLEAVRICPTGAIAIIEKD